MKIKLFQYVDEAHLQNLEAEAVPRQGEEIVFAFGGDPHWHYVMEVRWVLSDPDESKTPTLVPYVYLRNKAKPVSE